MAVVGFASVALDLPARSPEANSKIVPRPPTAGMSQEVVFPPFMDVDFWDVPAVFLHNWQSVS
jgi:hypothetical protein